MKSQRSLKRHWIRSSVSLPRGHFVSVPLTTCWTNNRTSAVLAGCKSQASFAWELLLSGIHRVFEVTFETS